MYTNSNGEQIKVETLETTHLINALAKKMREIYDCPNFPTYLETYEQIEALKQEYYKRLNLFAEKLEK